MKKIRRFLDLTKFKIHMRYNFTMIFFKRHPMYLRVTLLSLIVSLYCGYLGAMQLLWGSIVESIWYFLSMIFIFEFRKIFFPKRW